MNGVGARRWHPLPLLALGLAVAALGGVSDAAPMVDGFVELRAGVRIEQDTKQQDVSLGELRTQVDVEQDVGAVVVTAVADLVADPVVDQYSPDLDAGTGFLDLRQFNVLFSPRDDIDVKLGRQILTWGTGDLVFINDLFPKDFNSFFIGRDAEYLKAPSDALKISLFATDVNLDVVYAPRFDADQFIDGRRVSFFDVQRRERRGRRDPLRVRRPDDWFHDDEWMLRLYRTAGDVEMALYYYRGFWKSPAGLDAATGTALFPDLQVFGASLRAAVAGGIGHLELGYYRSDDDAKRDPALRNSEFRTLLGYEKEVAQELTAGVQFYVESKLDYAAYRASLPAHSIRDDEHRSVFTLRLTKLLWQQNLKLSLFNFYSHSDQDGYLRLNAGYKLTDAVKVEGGLNHFYGQEPHSFYAQFENNSNVYAAIRYSF